MSPVADAVGALLHEAHLAAAHELPDLAQRHVQAFGGREALCYLADLQQTVLVPFPSEEGAGPDEMLEPLAVDSTLAGRAFQRIEILMQPNRAGDATVWLPLLDGTERVGVLAVTVGDVGAELTDPLEDRLRCFASLMAELI